jgi:hypothetical protein
LSTDKFIIVHTGKYEDSRLSDMTGIDDDDYDDSWLHRNDQYDPSIGTNVEARVDDECVTQAEKMRARRRVYQWEYRKRKRNENTGDTYR